MDLIKLTRKRMVEEVFLFGGTKDSWRIFIKDETTELILSRLFSKSDILNYNFLDAIKIEDTTINKHFSALYFVDLNKKGYDSIKKDIKEKKYVFFYVLTVKESDYIKKLEGYENVQVKHVDFGYVPIEERLFVFIKIEDAIATICKMFKTRFVVHYVENKKNIAEFLYEKESKNSELNSDLLVLDRSIDMSTPLMHFFTFQSILSDLQIGEIDPEDPLWKKIRHVHMADINKVLVAESKEVFSAAKKIQGDISHKELLNLAVNFKERSMLSESLEKNFKYVDEIFSAFEGFLKNLAIVEQSISTRIGTNGRTYATAQVDVLKMLTDRNIKKTDKLRLLLLYIANFDVDQNVLRPLVQEGHFTESEISLVKKVKTYGYKPEKYQEKTTYEISRYIPVLKRIIESTIANKCKLSKFGVKNEMKLSLRKTTFIFKNDKIRDIMVVVFTDFVTWPEAQIVYEISRRLNIDIIIGAPEVLTPIQFIENLGRV